MANTCTVITRCAPGRRASCSAPTPSPSRTAPACRSRRAHEHRSGSRATGTNRPASTAIAAITRPGASSETPDSGPVLRMHLDQRPRAAMRDHRDLGGRGTPAGRPGRDIAQQLRDPRGEGPLVCGNDRDHDRDQCVEQERLAERVRSPRCPTRRTVAVVAMAVRRDPGGVPDRNRDQHRDDDLADRQPPPRQQRVRRAAGPSRPRSAVPAARRRPPGTARSRPAAATE